MTDTQPPGPQPTALGRLLRDHGSLLRYVLVGGFNTLLDIGLFTLLATVVRLYPLLANVISTAVVICVSYALNRAFVFRSDRKHTRTLPQFVIVTLFSALVVQSAVIWVVIHLGGRLLPQLPYDVLAPAAKVCATGVGMISNYLGYRWLFRPRHPA